jgi:hypothetical protein
MIVESIANNWDIAYNQFRNIEYKTLVDPVSQKKVIEVVQYLYNKMGKLEPTVKPRTIDVQA